MDHDIVFLMTLLDNQSTDFFTNLALAVPGSPTTELGLVSFESSKLKPDGHQTLGLTNVLPAALDPVALRNFDKHDSLRGGAVVVGF